MKSTQTVKRVCSNPDCRAYYANEHTTICPRCGWITTEKQSAPVFVEKGGADDDTVGK